MNPTLPKHLLNLCAVADAAQVLPIVSFNARDFGPASRFGIEIVTPKILLESLP